MPNVPMTNVNAYYSNTSPGNTILSNVIDAAIQDIVQAINDNWAIYESFVTNVTLPIPDQSIVERHIRNLAITNPKLAPSAVTNDKIADSTITATKLADLLITTSKLADLSVTNGKLVASAVTGDKIANSTITTENLQDFLITTAKLADGSVTNSKLSSGSVDSRVLTDGSVTATKIDQSLLGPISDATVAVKFGVIDTQLAETAKLSPGKKGILYAATIRNDGSGWAFITDSVHKNINFSSISIDDANKNIQVYYSERSKFIGGLLVTPDETLSNFGLTCGASVGDTVALIKCNAPFTGYIDGTGTIYCNPWFNGTTVVTPLADKTGFSVTYDGGGSSLDSVMTTTVRDSAAPYAGVEVRSARGANNLAHLRSFNDLYANIYYEGGVWKVSTACVADITCAFDTSTGILTITHAAMVSQSSFENFQSPVVTLRDSISGALIHARTVMTNHSTIQVIFRDNAGAPILTPNTNMRIYVCRPGFKVPHIWPNSMRAYFDFGYTVIRPSKLVSASGNLWILGLHQAN